MALRAPLPQTPGQILTWFLQLGFGAVFVYAGVVKLAADLGPISFTDDIRSFHLLPDPWPAGLAMSLPWLEIFCGLAVILGPLRRGALWLLVLCLVAFLGALAQAWARGLDVSCGCFGSSETHGTMGWLVTRDVALLAVGLRLAWLSGRPGVSREAATGAIH